MALITIGIDTSHNKQYSCVVSGFKNDIDKLYSDITKVLSRAGRKGVIHWKVMSSKIRKAAKDDIYKIVNEGKIHFTILEHKKPENVSRKEYYLVYVPNLISSYLEKWLIKKFGTVEIMIDKDYEVKGMKGTEVFIRNFLQQLSSRLSGIPVTMRKDKRFRTTVKQYDGSMIDFVASVSDRNESKAIQLADLVLGYYLYDKEGIENNVYFKKI